MARQDRAPQRQTRPKIECCPRETRLSAGALGLVKIAVDRRCVIAIFFQGCCADVDVCFAIAKDNRIGAFIAFTIDQGRVKQRAFHCLPARGAML